VLPPSESCNSRVNFESLYGICLDYPSTKDEITLPNAVRDKLIFIPSFNVCPVAPVLEDLSEPAKSTKLSLPALILYYPSLSASAVSMYIVNKLCDLDESWFMFVDAVFLFAVP